MLTQYIYVGAEFTTKDETTEKLPATVNRLATALMSR